MAPEPTNPPTVAPTIAPTTPPTTPTLAPMTNIEIIGIACGSAVLIVLIVWCIYRNRNVPRPIEIVPFINYSPRYKPKGSR